MSKQPLWDWTIRIVAGDFDRPAIRAAPVDGRHVPPGGGITSMYTDMDHLAVVEITVVAPDRTTAMKQAQALYEEQVPHDMRR